MAILFNTGAIKDDIDEYVKKYAEAIYEKAKKEIPQFAKYAILNYYDSYDPNYYVRTGNFMMNAYIPYAYKTSNNYFAGIKFNGNVYMNKYDGAGISTNDIHSNNMMGIHGQKVGLFEWIPIKTLSPYEIIEEKINSKSYQSECIAYGEKSAVSNGKYTILRFN